MNTNEAAAALEKLGFENVTVDKIGWAFAIEGDFEGVRIAGASVQLIEAFSDVVNRGLQARAARINRERAFSAVDEIGKLASAASGGAGYAGDGAQDNAGPLGGLVTGGGELVGELREASGVHAKSAAEGSGGESEGQ